MQQLTVGMNYPALMSFHLMPASKKTQMKTAGKENNNNNKLSPGKAPRGAGTKLLQLTAAMALGTAPAPRSCSRTPWLRARVTVHHDTSPSHKWPGGEATVTARGQTNPTERRAHDLQQRGGNSSSTSRSN